ncbi:MAG: hypothetical protein K8T20_14110 [Planctomycetes bacterium]|nr:hypothetical protein [Planctomycetota bacterium]
MIDRMPESDLNHEANGGELQRGRRAAICAISAVALLPTLAAVALVALADGPHPVVGVYNLASRDLCFACLMASGMFAPLLVARALRHSVRCFVLGVLGPIAITVNLMVMGYLLFFHEFAAGGGT